MQLVEGGDLRVVQGGWSVSYHWSFLHVLVPALAFEAYCLFSALQLPPFSAVTVRLVFVKGPELSCFARS